MTTATTRLVPSIDKIAEFLEMEESEILALIDDNHLSRTIVRNLQQKGVALTPSIKNTVEAVVRDLEHIYKRPATPPPGTKLTPPDGRRPDTEATATIMFTDMVESTALIQRLGDRMGHRLLSIQAYAIEKNATVYEGKVRKCTGDGFMVTFHSAHKALRCGINVQREIALYNRQARKSHIALRMGLSVGEPIKDNADLFGMAVIQASRIASVARANEILVSNIVYDLTSKSGDFEFKQIGPIDLKGFGDAQILYQLMYTLEESSKPNTSN